jgi:hypothetical protein
LKGWRGNTICFDGGQIERYMSNDLRRRVHESA